MPSRRTVVFLHGQPGTSVDSLRLRRALPPSLHLVAPDRPGYGANPRPATGFFGNASFVIQLLDTIEVESATLVGHSWGGGVALRVAQEHPERVDALVLAASVGPDCLNWFDRVLATPALGEVLTAPAFWIAAPIARPRLLRFLRVDTADPPERTLIERSLLGESRRATWRSFLVEQRALFTELPVVDEALERVRAPTTVVMGTRDHFVPAATARALVDRIPNARLETIEGVGHVLQLRAPGALARVVADTVDRVT
ncbi:MAG: alpha/beta hydrolase [Actinobacteria bacterium]|nr:alpha/beta hydrolase [Actinomycetota bacterium]